MRPAADRWHGETMPLLGGVAIVIASVGPIFVTGPERRLVVLAVAALARGSAGAHRRPADAEAAEAAEQTRGGDRPGHWAHPVRFRAPPDLVYTPFDKTSEPDGSWSSDQAYNHRRPTTGHACAPTLESSAGVRTRPVPVGANHDGSARRKPTLHQNGGASLKRMSSRPASSIMAWISPAVNRFSRRVPKRSSASVRIV